MSDHNTLPPDDSNRIDLETLVDALAPENKVGQPDEYYPSKGRVLEDDVDGTIYLGDGEQWLSVGTDTGLTTPAVRTDDATANNSLTYPDGTTVTDGPSSLLSEAGYEKGDVVPVAHLSAYNSFNLTTAATSFDRNFNYSLRSSPPSDALSPTGTLQVGVGGNAQVGTDETLTVRAVNSSQGDEITGASVQAQTDGPVWSGFAEYTPTDTTAPIRWAIEAKTEPGNNASEIQSGPLVLGVKI